MVRLSQTFASAFVALGLGVYQAEAADCAEDDSALLHILNTLVSGASGLTLSLNYVKNDLAPGYPFQGMAVELGLPGTDGRPQQMLLDTGSSEFAFCNASLADMLAKYRTPFAQAGVYGPPSFLEGCQPAYPEAWYGSLYSGDVDFLGIASGDKKQESSFSMKNVSYAVMDMQSHMTCAAKFDGIFGVAFEFPAWKFSVANGNASLLIKECSQTVKGFHMYELIGQGHGIGERSIVPCAMAQTMADNAEHKFGLFVDYAATEQLPFGTHKDLGLLYIGNAAVQNSYFLDAPAKTTFSTLKGISGGGRGYWSFALTNTSVRAEPGGDEVVHWPINPNWCFSSPCYVDSGTPSIVLPKEMYSFGEKEYKAGNKDAEINLQVLEGSEKTGLKHVSVSLPVAFLLEQHKLGWVSLTESFGVVLGLPFFKLNYVVFDEQAKTITVAPLRARGKIEDTSD